jgi:murein DD-endopeptidase MepM/ murein hydrolase activator NlpD
MPLIDDEETQLNYTPVAGPKFAGARKSVFTNPLSYPTQGNSVDISKHGEYRRRYVSGNHPEWSKFWAERPTSRHNGIDIYAPVGTPVVALCAGGLEMVTGSEGPIGRRAWLRFVYAGAQWRLVYGHLSEFNGASRSVQAGEVIGKVGCSGNADGGGLCSLNPSQGLPSSHLHLSLFLDTAAGVKPYDPAFCFSMNLV